MRLNEIQERLSQIDKELDNEGIDIQALTEETDGLMEERKTIMKEADDKKEMRKRIAEMEIKPVAESKPIEEERKMELTYAKDSQEYRNAWLNQMRGVQLEEVEKRALTAAGVVPDSTANMIVEKMVDMVPLLNEIELLRVKGNVSFNVESAAPIPTYKAGGAAVDEATTTLVEVSLGSYTISTLVRVGADLASMAIGAFEEWLTRKLAESLAYKIEDAIINGNGSSAPTGIDKAYQSSAWADGTDAVDWASSALGVADLDEAIGLLPAAYDSNSKFLMSKKTFFTSAINLTDVNNFPVVEKEGTTYLLRGYPVIFSDKVTAGDVFFGDLKRGMVGNLSNEMQVEKGRNLAYNAYDFLGWCSFDCKPSGVLAIIKIAADIV